MSCWFTNNFVSTLIYVFLVLGKQDKFIAIWRLELIHETQCNGQLLLFLLYIYIYNFLGVEILFIKRYSLRFMSNNTWLSINVGTKLLPDLVMFLRFVSDILLDFYESIGVVLKYLIYFLAGINTK